MKYSSTKFCLFVSLLLIFSCSEDLKQEKIETQKDWSGAEEDFYQDFSVQSKDNSTILISSSSSLPFDGTIERNSSTTSTTQSFRQGQLDGASIKKSKDGSWVKAHYQNGKLNGEMIFYSKNGNVRTILHYENGKLSKGQKLD
jgi:antitoxin component YwqK of YwqJK toxin-antitoxin module